MGTLLAFTIVAISILILRYIPPDQVPLPPSLQESLDIVSLGHSSSAKEINVTTPKDNIRQLRGSDEASLVYPLITRDPNKGSCNLTAFISYFKGCMLHANHSLKLLNDVCVLTIAKVCGASLLTPVRLAW